MGKSVHQLAIFLFSVICMMVSNSLLAQIDSTSKRVFGKIGNNPGVEITADSNAVSKNVIDSIPSDSLVDKKKIKHDFKYHSPKKATWMSAVLPSLGQFYNRRYWKPPIIYAGLGVAIYFLIDNQMKFIVARNSYRARLNVPGFTVDSKYTSLSAEQILADRDFYRNNRDYSIIGIGGVYLLNIIDALVDAHLRTFDVSDDLSMKFRPSFQYASTTMQNGFAPMPGISWSLKF